MDVNKYREARYKLKRRKNRRFKQQPIWPAIAVLGLVAFAGIQLTSNSSSPPTPPPIETENNSSSGSENWQTVEGTPFFGGIFYTWYYDEISGVRDGKHTEVDWTELYYGKPWRPRPDSADAQTADYHIELMQAANANLFVISWGFGRTGWAEHFERSGKNYANRCELKSMAHAAWIDSFQTLEDIRRALVILKNVSEEHTYYLDHPESGKPVVFINGSSRNEMSLEQLEDFFNNFHLVFSTGDPAKFKEIAGEREFDMCLYNAPYLDELEYREKIQNIKNHGINYWHIPFWQFQNAPDNTGFGKNPHQFPKLESGELAPWALDGVIDSRDLDFDNSQWLIGIEFEAIGFIPPMNERGEWSGRIGFEEIGEAMYDSFVLRGQAWEFN